MIKSPCYKCEERRFNCHSVCEKYLAFVAEGKARREMIQKAKEIMYISYTAKEDKDYWKQKKLQAQGKGKYAKK